MTERLKPIEVLLNELKQEAESASEHDISVLHIALSRALTSLTRVNFDRKVRAFRKAVKHISNT